MAPRGILRPEDWARGLELVLGDPGWIRMVFQPILDLARGRIAGYEALARFACEPLAGPDAWLRQAWSIGLGPRLESVLVEKALAARPSLPPGCFLTVNISPPAVLSADVQARLAGSDLTGVIIELTEETRISSYEDLLDALAPSRARGALIAVDDAGSGYAGLEQLMRLRPQLVKLDRALVAGVDRDPVRRALVRTLGGFAGELDAWLLAEGVETEGEAEVLVDLGVPLAQGYGLGRPAPPFAEIDAGVAEVLLRRSSMRGRGTILPLVEAPAAAGGDSRAASTDGFEALLGNDSRPVGLRHEGDGIRDARRARQRLLVVQPHEDPAAVLLRALIRDGSDRSSPVVCCDEAGRYLGLIRMESLAECVAREAIDLREARRAATSGQVLGGDARAR